MNKPFSYLLSKNVNIKIYKTIVLTVTLHRSETLSRNGKNKKLMVSEMMTLRRIIYPEIGRNRSLDEIT